MGRGIDFNGVNMVVNYDFPPSAVSYIHRIGRTILLFGLISQNMLGYFIIWVILFEPKNKLKNRLFLDIE